MSTSQPVALIIGASGQVGRHCVHSFQERGYRTIGTYSSKKAEGLVHLDLTRVADVRALVRDSSPSVCVLSSALTNVDRCEDEPTLARALNADAAEVIASSCLDLGTQLVYVSTEYVFDGKDGPYDELAPPHPVSAYGKTKLDGERLVLQTSRENLVVRTTVVYSWDVTGKNFVMQVINGLRAGRVLRIPNDQRSSPTYAPDLASAIGDLCVRKGEGIVNVAGPEVLDRFSFAKLIADVFELGAQALEPVATRLLGQKAQRPLDAGLRDGRMVSILGRPLRGPLDGLGDLRRIAEAAA